MKTYSLRDARRKAKLTQAQLAVRSEVDQTTISRLETDKDPNPTTRTVERLAKALGIAPFRLRFSEPLPDAAKVSRRNDRTGQSRQAVA